MTTETTPVTDEASTAIAEPTSPCPFMVGDVVCLRSNAGLAMTVEGHFTHPAANPPIWMIGLVWFDCNNELQRAALDAAVLRLY